MLYVYRNGLVYLESRAIRCQSCLYINDAPQLDAPQLFSTSFPWHMQAKQPEAHATPALPFMSLGTWEHTKETGLAK